MKDLKNKTELAKTNLIKTDNVNFKLKNIFIYHAFRLSIFKS